MKKGNIISSATMGPSALIGQVLVQLAVESVKVVVPCAVQYMSDRVRNESSERISYSKHAADSIGQTDRLFSQLDAEGAALLKEIIADLDPKDRAEIAKFLAKEYMHQRSIMIKTGVALDATYIVSNAMTSWLQFSRLHPTKKRMF